MKKYNNQKQKMKKKNNQKQKINSLKKKFFNFAKIYNMKN